jgi:hypothetical protein
MKLPLRDEPALHKTVEFHALPDDRFAVHSVIDVEPILEENAAVRAIQPEGWKRNEHLVASIPMPIWQALRTTWQVLGLSTHEQQQALHRFLNDPDNAKFRTKHGRL